MAWLLEQENMFYAFWSKRTYSTASGAALASQPARGARGSGGRGKGGRGDGETRRPALPPSLARLLLGGSLTSDVCIHVSLRVWSHVNSCLSCVTCVALIAAFSLSHMSRFSRSHMCRFSHSKARSRRRKRGGAARSRQRRSKRSGPSTSVLSALRRHSRTRGSSSGCWLPWPPLSFPIGSVPTCVRPSVRPAFFSLQCVCV